MFGPKVTQHLYVDCVCVVRDRCFVDGDSFSWWQSRLDHSSEKRWGRYCVCVDCRHWPQFHRQHLRRSIVLNILIVEKVQTNFSLISVLFTKRSHSLLRGVHTVTFSYQTGLHEIRGRTLEKLNGYYARKRVKP